MIEKTSKDLKCVVCGEPATVTVAGNPYCDKCKDSESAKEAQELQDCFKG